MKVKLKVQSYWHGSEILSFDVVRPYYGDRSHTWEAGKILKDSRGYLWRWTDGFITSQGPNPSIFNGRTDTASEV